MVLLSNPVSLNSLETWRKENPKERARMTSNHGRIWKQLLARGRECTETTICKPKTTERKNLLSQIEKLSRSSPCQSLLLLFRSSVPVSDFLLHAQAIVKSASRTFSFVVRLTFTALSLSVSAFVFAFVVLAKRFQLTSGRVYLPKGETNSIPTS